MVQLSRFDRVGRNTVGIDELSELKAHFLSTLNCEIRTPLTGILGMLDLLLETELSGEQREYAEVSRLCADNLLEIMNRTLDIAALSANQVILEEYEFPLRDFLDWVLIEHAARAEAKGLTFIRNLDHSNLPAMVIGDAQRLKQMLGNLVENAIKFTSQGEVEVSARAQTIDDSSVMLCLRVRDTGIGIDADKLECIFYAFGQLDTGITRRYTGMGLGLAVTSKLAKLMSADVTVESEPNKGSTFTLMVPLKLPVEAVPSGYETGPEVFTLAPLNTLPSYRPSSRI